MKTRIFLLFILAFMILPLAACSVHLFQVKDEVIQDDPLATYDAGYAFSVDGYFFFTDFSSVYRMKQGDGKAEKLFTTNGGVDAILYQSGYIYIQTYESSRYVNYRCRTNGSGLERLSPGGSQWRWTNLLFATGGKVYYRHEQYIQFDTASGESKIVEDIKPGSIIYPFGWKGKAYYATLNELYQITDEGKSKKCFTGYAFPMGGARYLGRKGTVTFTDGYRSYEYDTETEATTERPEFADIKRSAYVGARDGSRYYYYAINDESGLCVSGKDGMKVFDLPGGAFDFVFNEKSGRFYFWCDDPHEEYWCHLKYYDVESGKITDILGKSISRMQDRVAVHFTQDFVYYIDSNEIHAIDTRNGNDTLLYRGEESLLSPNEP